jgi:NAD(P)-dependent dehydrogenase (short-subunit alcohol dehydrogenase family)
MVTGASRGIGAAVAARLALDGFSVLAPSRQELDLASEASIDLWLARLETPVDVLVNNAGLNFLGRAAEISNSKMSEMLGVNLVAPLRLSAAIASGMKERRTGRIVNLASIWALVSRERRVAYSAAKAGLVGLTRALAVELAPAGILVNAVAPGYVNTDMTRRNNSPEEIEAIHKQIPLGRMAEPGEIAEVVAFLCSEKNTYLTGQLITVDGGFTCL